MDTVHPEREGIDLTNCDREPIHIPGKIQSHGFLIALDSNLTITHCSSNIFQFIETTATDLLGQPVNLFEKWLNTPGTEPVISQLINASTNIRGFTPQNPYPVYIKQQYFNLILSRTGNFYVLEFEPEFSDLKQNLQQYIGSSISEMLADADLNQLLTNTVRQIKKIIAYDRVMIYKFHKDGHGEVIAEEKLESLSPFFGLHYPASDIPKQARDLYKINLIRLISDVSKDPSAILSVIDSNLYPLDLTNMGLRAVSPVHIQYLKNMGVASSFSISLLDKDELWGLVACHNYTPRFINYKEREAAKLIGQVLSSALGFRETKEDELKKSALKLKVNDLIRNLVREENITHALCNCETTMLDAADAEGAALVFDRHIQVMGKVPPIQFIQELCDWLQKNADQSIFQTDRLPKLFPESVKYRDSSSGILACRINRELEEYLIWFRPEVSNTVRWAGNPEKPAVDASNILKISPRTSFEVWSEEVLMTSTPWETEDIDSANHLREEVSFTINRRASELRLLNEKLKGAYDELATFSYTISHDLKNPLSSIKGFTELILSDESPLTPDQKFMLERVQANANKMQRMIADVLEYSKAGSGIIFKKNLDMKEILSELIQELLIGTNHPYLEIAIVETPPVKGNKTMVIQIFSNLLGNAVKYSLKQERPFIEINGKMAEGGVLYAVKDNGIGINEKDRDKIFELFSRLEEASEYEGTGVGLAIVQKLVNKHEGKIWVESNPGGGSTFFVFFKN